MYRLYVFGPDGSSDTISMLSMMDHLADSWSCSAAEAWPTHPSEVLGARRHSRRREQGLVLAQHSTSIPSSSSSSVSSSVSSSHDTKDEDDGVGVSTVWSPFVVSSRISTSLASTSSSSSSSLSLSSSALGIGGGGGTGMMSVGTKGRGYNSGGIGGVASSSMASRSAMDGMQMSQKKMGSGGVEDRERAKEDRCRSFFQGHDSFGHESIAKQTAMGPESTRRRWGSATFWRAVYRDADGGEKGMRMSPNASSLSTSSGSGESGGSKAITQRPDLFCVTLFDGDMSFPRESPLLRLDPDVFAWCEKPISAMSPATATASLSDVNHRLCKCDDSVFETLVAMSHYQIESTLTFEGWQRLGPDFVIRYGNAFEDKGIWIVEVEIPLVSEASIREEVSMIDMKFSQFDKVFCDELGAFHARPPMDAFMELDPSQKLYPYQTYYVGLRARLLQFLYHMRMLSIGPNPVDSSRKSSSSVLKSEVR